MAVSAKIDLIEDLTAQEHLGVVTALTRRALVIGLTDMDVGIIASALAYLDTQGYTYGSTPEDYPNLKLSNRDPAVHPRDNTKAYVTLSYVHFSQYEGQLIIGGDEGLTSRTAYYEHRSNLERLRTNKSKYTYITGEETPANEGDDILSVTYTYPAASKESPGQAGKTVTQAAEIDVDMDRGEIRLVGLIRQDWPEKFVKLMRGRVNYTSWFEGGPRTWKIVDVGYFPFDIDSTPITYKFELLFRHRPEGWDPTAVFVDPVTGRPPKDVNEGVNYGVAMKTVEFDRPAEFNDLLKYVGPEA